MEEIGHGLSGLTLLCGGIMSFTTCFVMLCNGASCAEASAIGASVCCGSVGCACCIVTTCAITVATAEKCSEQRNSPREALNPFRFKHTKSARNTLSPLCTEDKVFTPRPQPTFN